MPRRSKARHLRTGTREGAEADGPCSDQPCGPSWAPRLPSSPPQEQALACRWPGCACHAGDLLPWQGLGAARRPRSPPMPRRRQREQGACDQGRACTRLCKRFLGGQVALPSKLSTRQALQRGCDQRNKGEEVNPLLGRRRTASDTRPVMGSSNRRRQRGQPGSQGPKARSWARLDT